MLNLLDRSLCRRGSFGVFMLRPFGGIAAWARSRTIGRALRDCLSSAVRAARAAGFFRNGRSGCVVSASEPQRRITGDHERVQTAGVFPANVRGHHLDRVGRFRSCSFCSAETQSRIMRVFSSSPQNGCFSYRRRQFLADPRRSFAASKHEVDHRPVDGTGQDFGKSLCSWRVPLRRPRSRPRRVGGRIGSGCHARARNERQ